MRKASKIILLVLISILLLIFLALGFLLTPTGQDFVRVRAVKFLHNKIGTEVQIGGLSYELPKSIVLERVLIKDKQKDTLLYAGALSANLDMLALLSNKVKVNDLALRQVFFNMQRPANDTNYNFQYIIDAFVGEQKAAKQEEVKKTSDSSSALQFDVGTLTLEQVRFRLNDIAGGIFLDTRAQQLIAQFNTIDIEKELYLLKRIDAKGLQTAIVQGKSLLPNTPDDTSTTNLTVGVEDIVLNATDFYYKDLYTQLIAEVNLKTANLSSAPIQLNKQFIAINKLLLDTGRVRVEMNHYDKDLAKTIDSAFALEDTTEAQGWRIVATSTALNGLDISYNDNRAPKQPRGIDYNHLEIRNLQFDAANIGYTADTIAATINQLALREQSGLHVQRLRTNLVYHNQGGHLNNLLLQTDNSLLQHSLAVRYPSVAAVSTRPQSLFIQSDIRNTIVGVKDLLLFAPQLRSQPLIGRNPNARIRTNLVAIGYLNDLAIKDFYLSGLGQTQIKANGRLQGLPEMNRLHYALNLSEFSSTRNDLATLIPAENLKDIRLPDRFSATGTIAGGINYYQPNLRIKSSDGNADIRGSMNLAAGSGREVYDLHINTQDLHIGRIIKQEKDIGRISAKLHLKGKGFDPKTMTATAKGNIYKAQYRGYNYNDVALDVKANAGIIDAHVISNDPNAQLDIAANIDMRGASPKVSGRLMLDSIDFQRLGFYDKEFRIRGKIISDFKDLDPDYPIGTLTMDHPIVVYDGKRFVLDSLWLVSAPQNGNQDIKLYADVMSAELSGRLPLTRAGDVILQRLDKYYDLATYDGSSHERVVTRDGKKEVNQSKNPLPEDYDLTLHALIYDRPLLYAFMPSLTYFDSASLYASFTPYFMSFDAFVPTIEMGNSEATNIVVKATGADSALRYALNTEYLKLPYLNVWDGQVSGEVKNSVVSTVVRLADEAKRDRFSLAGLLYRNEGQQTFSLGDSLMLDYKKWQVNQPNRFVFGEQGFYVDNFRVAKANEQININSTPPQFNAPLSASFQDFRLSNITSILNQDTLLANGSLNGVVKIHHFDPTLNLDANLYINHFTLYGDTVGLVKANAATTDGNDYKTNVTITENGNDIQLTGSYFVNPVAGNNMDMNLAVNALSLAAMQGASLGALTNSSGFVRGSLAIKGTTAQPRIHGALQTDQLSTRVALLGSQWRLPKEKVTIEGGLFTFNEVKLYDTMGRYAAINGIMRTTDFSSYDMNLGLRADKWMVMNSTAKQNKDFYGKMWLTTDLTLRGNNESPDIDGALTIHDSTQMTVVLPETKKEIESAVGIVRFEDFSDSNAHLLIPRTLDTLRTLVMGLGSRVNVNLNVEKEATFNVQMEEGTGDFLQVKGTAALNTAVNPDGSLGLTGMYELEGGAYEFNYNFIKRKFLIQKGSVITFLGGDPTEAELSVKAVYEADVPPYDLVQNQVDQNDLVFYHQRLPFNVVLNLTGPMLKPVLTFDIELPEEKAVRAASGVSETVQGKLAALRNDASEMNKQVFAVLLLNRFVGENPFAMSNALNVEYAVRQSVSRFITEQLNRFADQLIEGIDLSVDLSTSEDYTTGERRNRTDLTWAASKRLLNDRLTITIGSDYALEGPAGNRENALIPGNLSLDYTLTRDGRYAIRAYRMNRNMGVVEGYVVETGLKFRMNVSYDKFREVFESPRKREARLQKQRAQMTPAKTDTSD